MPSPAGRRDQWNPAPAASRASRACPPSASRASLACLPRELAEGIHGIPPSRLEGIKGIPPQPEGNTGMPTQRAEGIRGIPPSRLEGIRGIPPSRGLESRRDREPGRLLNTWHVYHRSFGLHYMRRPPCYEHVLLYVALLLVGAIVAGIVRRGRLPDLPDVPALPPGDGPSSRTSCAKLWPSRFYTRNFWLIRESSAQRPALCGGARARVLRVPVLPGRALDGARPAAAPARDDTARRGAGRDWELRPAAGASSRSSPDPASPS